MSGATQAEAKASHSSDAVREALSDLVAAATKELEAAKASRQRRGATSMRGSADPHGPSEETVAALQRVDAAVEEQERLIAGFQKENERLMTQLRQCVVRAAAVSCT